MAAENDEITVLLNRTDPSGRSADQLWELVYPELRRRARKLFKNERADHTLSATAIINEVFVRLSTASAREWHDRSHFYAAASGIMRHVLIDHARARTAAKRGGDVLRETLDENVFPAVTASESGYREAQESLPSFGPLAGQVRCTELSICREREEDHRIPVEFRL